MQKILRKLAILISGTGSNMESIINSCGTGDLANKFKVDLVISNKSDAPGIQKAKDLGIPVVVIENKGLSREEHETLILKEIKRHRIDLICLAGYMRILTGNFVSKVSCGIVNIHPTDTDVYKGARGYEYVFENRKTLKTNRCTVHFVDAGVDTGKVICYGEKYSLESINSIEELKSIGVEFEHKAYIQGLLNLLVKNENPKF